MIVHHHCGAYVACAALLVVVMAKGVRGWLAYPIFPRREGGNKSMAFDYQFWCGAGTLSPSNAGMYISKFDIRIPSFALFSFYLALFLFLAVAFLLAFVFPHSFRAPLIFLIHCPPSLSLLSLSLSPFQVCCFHFIYNCIMGLYQYRSGNRGRNNL